MEFNYSAMRLLTPKKLGIKPAAIQMITLTATDIKGIVSIKLVCFISPIKRKEGSANATIRPNAIPKSESETVCMANSLRKSLSFKPIYLRTCHARLCFSSVFCLHEASNTDAQSKLKTPITIKYVISFVSASQPA